jgi:PhnB protein
MSAIPEGFTTLTPSLSVKDAARAIELYKKAFGAKELSRMADPESGKIMHAVLEIGSSKIFVADVFPNCPANQSSFYVYMPDVDASMKQAEQAGMKNTMPVTDMFWGDRMGAVTDEFGINWTIATHVRDVSDADLEKGRQEFCANMGKKSSAA